MFDDAVLEAVDGVDAGGGVESFEVLELPPSLEAALLPLAVLSLEEPDSPPLSDLSLEPSVPLFVVLWFGSFNLSE